MVEGTQYPLDLILSHMRTYKKKKSSKKENGLDFVSKPLFLYHLNNCSLNMQNAVRGLKNALKSNVMTST